MEKFEIYQVGSLTVIFWGVMGERGMLVFRKDTGWEYHPSDSIFWDSLHQEVYRNFKGDRLTKADLKKRGIPMPTFKDYEERVRILDWEDNFTAEMPYSKAPARVLRKLREYRGEPVQVYLLLLEDYYETCFGDGKYLYPEAAFRSRKKAGDEMKRRIREETDPARREWYKYSLKEVTLAADESKELIVAGLNIEPFQHYSVEDIVELL